MGKKIALCYQDSIFLFQRVKYPVHSLKKKSHMDGDTIDGVRKFLKITAVFF
jgi:hypothetical protein